MLSIRLIRRGKRNRPSFRLVVQDKSKAPSGNYIEVLGSYDPIRQPWEVKIDKDRYRHWLSLGAQPTDTVKSLIKKAS